MYKTFRGAQHSRGDLDCRAQGLPAELLHLTDEIAAAVERQPRKTAGSR
jgi:hypothetical protein